MGDVKVIAPRMPTPPPTGQVGKATGRVTTDLLSEQVQRLTLLSAIGIGLWAFGLSLDTVFLPYRDAPTTTWRGPLIETLGIVVSTIMFLYLRFTNHAAQAKTLAGLGYLLLNAFMIAMLNSWATIPSQHTMSHLSWITILILVFSMVAPATPRRILWVSMAAASM